LLAGLGIDAMDQQRRLRVVDQRQVGEDIRLLLRP
jgi:diaminohydroxyphosphoribosylaminopyrimidine deaminase/5-amino-6-(5-phosphoribosylamino)uracil reductase